MKIGIMQPYFIPYIGYWQLMNIVDRYVIYDDVNYIKGGWINKNNILMNGKATPLTLKLSGVSSNKNINEINVVNDLIYRKKVLKTLEQSYKKAPYYKDVLPVIEKIINHEEDTLSLYLENSIKEIASYLNIRTEILTSSSIEKNNELKGQEKVIEICDRLQANEYYNAIGGENLYSSNYFLDNNIQLNFLKTEVQDYQQFKHDHTPNLSIIDIMMFNSKDQIKKMLNQFSIINYSEENVKTEFKSLHNRVEIEELLKTFNDVFVPPLKDRVFDFEQYAQKLEEYGYVYQVKVQNNLSGFIAFYSNDYENKIGYLAQIALNPEYQGMGLGTKLLKLFEDVSKANGMNVFKLEVLNENHHAIKFYKKYGYKYYDKASDTSQYLIKTSEGI